MQRPREWIRIASDRPVVQRALITSLAVGTILTAVNHPDALLRLDLAGVAWQIALTFVVPYGVSTVSSVAAIMAHRQDTVRDYQLLEREIQAINKFPDQNPNPVLRMAADGRLTYANESSAPIVAALGLVVGASVPGDARAQLTAAAGASPPWAVEVSSGLRTFALLPVRVPELDVINLYGTEITANKVVERFPDRNPNPVMRMAGDGSLLYANEASRPITRALDMGVGDPFPADLLERLRACLERSGPGPIEVHGEDRTYELSPVLIPEFGFTNIYGTDVTAAREIEQANRENERLLLNILPPSIARRLRSGEMVIADRFDEMTVLFADVVGFTQLSARLSPTEVVDLLNRCFSTFDRLADRYELEKIKTIGDAYMVVGGLTPDATDHPERVADMGLEMIAEIARVRSTTDHGVEIRVGMHTGPAVAGVIGIKKFIYDVWGDTVNTASRMESHGVPGRVQVTGAAHERLKDAFLLEPRGTIEVKGKGPTDTWFLVGRREGSAPQS